MNFELFLAFFQQKLVNFLDLMDITAQSGDFGKQFAKQVKNAQLGLISIFLQISISES